MFSKTALLLTVVSSGIYLLFLTAFLFWFVYLLQAIQQNWNSYKACLRNLDSSTDSQDTAYKAKTEFVKHVFLFAMNIVELLAITLTFIPCTISPIFIEPNYFNESRLLREVNDTFAHQLNVLFHQSGKVLSDNVNVKFMLYINTLATNLFVLSLSLFTSLCIYLSSRYAHKSWIESTNIGYYLGITVVSIVIIQLCTLICILTVITRLIHCVIEAILFVLLIKHSRRLKMVVNWTIVDLKISKTKKALCKKLTRMQKSFVRFLSILWIGILFLFLTDILSSVLIVFNIAWDNIYFESSNFNFCKIRHHPIADDITTTVNLLLFLFFYIGATCIIIPYTVTGLYKMSIVIWRRVKGQTGYKTKFRNPLLQ